MPINKINEVDVDNINKINEVSYGSLTSYGDVSNATYFSATGGTKTTVTISGTDYYVHLFTSSGNFNISTIGEDDPRF